MRAPAITTKPTASFHFMLVLLAREYTLLRTLFINGKYIFLLAFLRFHLGCPSVDRCVMWGSGTRPAARHYCRDHRHAARGSRLRTGRKCRSRAGTRSVGARGSRVSRRDRTRTADAAVARLDLHGTLSHFTRRARQRRLPVAGIGADARVDAARRGVSHGGVRLIVRAARDDRPGARFRRVRRSVRRSGLRDAGRVAAGTARADRKSVV